MSSINSGVGTALTPKPGRVLRSSNGRKRFSRALAAGAALTVVVTGISVPAANALPLKAGDLVKETTFTTAGMLHAGAVTANPATGDVYVADQMSDKIFRFSKSGTLLGSRGGKGVAAGLFDDPMDIAVNAAGEVYVADSGNHRIQKFTSGLGFLTQWGSEGNAVGQFKSPKGLAVSPATGNVVVADSNNHRVQRFGPNGGNASAWGSQGAEPGKLSFPADVAVTPGSAVLVADNGNDAIKTFTAGGGYVSHFGKTGVELGQLKNPGHLAIDKNGDIFVADVGNARVQRFAENGAVKDSVSLNGLTGLGLDTSLGRMFITDGLGKTVHVYRQATAPSIDNCPATAGTVGAAYSSKIITGGFPNATLSVWSGKLPTGVSLVGDTVKGTPTVAGVFDVEFKADNGVATLPGITKKCKITIDPAPAAPVITVGPKLTGNVGVPYESVVKATGYPDPTFSIAAGALPPGLVLAANGTISGTPTKSGVFQVTIQAKNGVLPVSAKQYQIVISEAPAIVVGPNLSGTVGVGYNSVLKASGYPVPTFSVTSGALPPGLSLSANGTLAGTPQKAGSFDATIQAQNGVNPAASKAYTIVIAPAPAAPVITVGPALSGNVGKNYLSVMKANGFPEPTFKVIAGALPPGLTLDADGTISGVPGKPGSYDVTISAQNGVNPSASKAYTLTIGPALEAPTITEGPVLKGTTGEQYSSLLKATGYPAPSFSVTKGSLPPGLKLVGSSISGIPTQPGSFALTLQASNGVDPVASQDYLIEIAPKPMAPLITTGPKLEGVVGLGYVSILSATGLPAVSDFSVVAGQLPPGLSLDGGIISGTPTQAGSFAVAIRAQNGVEPAATKDYTIKIAAEGVAPTITMGPKVEGVLGVGYLSVLKADGFPSYADFSVVGGTLPPGLTLNGNTISGTPSQVGTFPVAIEADNGIAPKAVEEYEIKIAAVGVAPAITVGPKTDGVVGSSYVSVLQTTGFPSAAVFSVSAGALPPGLVLDGDTISGTPSTAGSYAFALRAENGVAPAAVKEYTIKIAAAGIAPQFVAGPKVLGTAGKWYSSKLSASGSPAAAYSIASGALPTGLKLAGGTIYGTPTRPGTYKFTLRADNKVAPVAVKAYYITIAKASSRVTAKFSTKYPRAASTRVKATIKLSAPYTTGLSKTGKVRVYYGKKRVKTYSVKSYHKGVLKVRLPKFTKKGKTKVTLRYLGNSQLKSAKRTIYVRVR